MVVVSIPQRYARNSPKASWDNPRQFLFQFLIGTLETFNTENQKLRFFEFQFLIGTLETGVAVLCTMIPLGGFNSSQVRQKRHNCYLCDAGWDVSIPHRYARNEDGSDNALGEYVFQFLIGTLETRNWRKWDILHKQFQFLIGTLETQPVRKTVSAVRMGFNSSQVRQKLLKHYQGLQLHLCFNSSQVRQKRPAQGTRAVAETIVSIPHRYARNSK